MVSSVFFQNDWRNSDVSTEFGLQETNVLWDMEFELSPSRLNRYGYATGIEISCWKFKPHPGATTVSEPSCTRVRTIKSGIRSPLHGVYCSLEHIRGRIYLVSIICASMKRVWWRELLFLKTRTERRGGIHAKNRGDPLHTLLLLCI